MQFVAVLAVEIFLQHQLAPARDQQRVYLWRVDRIHRHVDDLLHDALDGSAIDADSVHACSRQTIVQSRRYAVDVARGVLAPRIEITLVVIAPEIVVATAVGKIECDNLLRRVVRPIDQHRVTGLRGPPADQTDGVSGANQSPDTQ